MFFIWWATSEFWVASDSLWSWHWHICLYSFISTIVLLADKRIAQLEVIVLVSANKISLNCIWFGFSCIFFYCKLLLASVSFIPSTAMHRWRLGIWQRPNQSNRALLTRVIDLLESNASKSVNARWALLGINSVLLQRVLIYYLLVYDRSWQYNLSNANENGFKLTKSSLIVADAIMKHLLSAQTQTPTQIESIYLSPSDPSSKVRSSFITRTYVHLSRHFSVQFFFQSLLDFLIRSETSHVNQWLIELTLLL